MELKILRNLRISNTKNSDKRYTMSKNTTDTYYLWIFVLVLASTYLIYNNLELLYPIPLLLFYLIPSSLQHWSVVETRARNDMETLKFRAEFNLKFAQPISYFILTLGIIGFSYYQVYYQISGSKDILPIMIFFLFVSIAGGVVLGFFLSRALRHYLAMTRQFDKHNSPSTDGNYS